MSSRSHKPKIPSKKAIDRAVASSTAIETGKKVRQLESLLRDKPVRFRNLMLAK
jgi:hypothetical protein